MTGLQVGVECCTIVVDFVEHDSCRSLIQSHDVELTATRPVGKRMSGVITRQRKKVPKAFWFHFELGEDYERARCPRPPLCSGLLAHGHGAVPVKQP